MSEQNELAGLISSVLKNPNTPQPLKDVLRDGISFLSQYADNDSPEMIALCLKGYEQNGNDEQIEVTRGDGIAVIAGEPKGR